MYRHHGLISPTSIGIDNSEISRNYKHNGLYIHHYGHEAELNSWLMVHYVDSDYPIGGTMQLSHFQQCIVKRNNVHFGEVLKFRKIENENVNTILNRLNNK